MQQAKHSPYVCHSFKRIYFAEIVCNAQQQQHQAFRVISICDSDWLQNRWKLNQLLCFPSVFVCAENASIF